MRRTIGGAAGTAWCRDVVAVQVVALHQPNER